MKRLIQTLEQLNIESAEEKAELLKRYMEMLLERNRQVNLTAIKDPDEFIEKHYVDSLACAGLEQIRQAENVLDLGTGGGFPGIPLAVAFPEKSFTLLDSLNKRIRIIQEFCEELGIGNVTAIHGRAEELGRQAEMRDGFDLCVSRAVADLRVLAEYCLPFVKPGGWFIAYKGADCHAETESAKRAVKMLGGEITGSIRAAEALGGSKETGNAPVSTPASEHQLVLIKKLSPTPAAYPRKPGTPAKKPL